ncbi:MAG: hypothetical protein N4A68_07560 [Maledivibacter sp.]|jgi:archaellum biogenesis protein FlaJ (TadC family)|nr:hypothetical protein [Maledivibacter sp.]
MDFLLALEKALNNGYNMPEYMQSLYQGITELFKALAEGMDESFSNFSDTLSSIYDVVFMNQNRLDVLYDEVYKLNSKVNFVFILIVVLFVMVSVSIGMQIHIIKNMKKDCKVNTQEKSGERSSGRTMEV